MRKLFILGNWKTYPLAESVHEWFAEAALHIKQLQEKNAVVILCPPASLLWECRQAITTLGLSETIQLGAQDISPFTPGAHTGDESAKFLKKHFGIEYTLVGHSERRREHGETHEVLVEKVARALEQMITPIFCVQNEHTIVPMGIDIVAYEPPAAISAVSGGIAQDPLATQKTAAIMRDRLAKQHSGSTKGTYVLYGGSVNADNVAKFTNNNQLAQNFDGVIVGAKSLTQEFFTIAQHA